MSKRIIKKYRKNKYKFHNQKRNYMKKLFVASFIFAMMSMGLYAQDQNDKKEEDAGYKFTVVKENAITSVKNQQSAGTCWSWSGFGFLESEVIRMGKGPIDLSAMYCVRRNYDDQAVKYVRMNGEINFSQGGSFADVIETLNDYGVVPLTEYEGLNYGTTTHQHNEVFDVLNGYITAVNKKSNGSLSTAWKNGFKGILDAYFGEIPQSVTYKGVQYTPQGLAKFLGLNGDNYISLTSFTHHPFYKPFAIEVADNWRWALSYNLPLDEMMEAFDNAIMNGYTIAWASDVSEIGFTRDGLAVIPDETSPEIVGSDQAHWLGLSQREQLLEMRDKLTKEPVPQKVITQELRQIAFDNQETTDDHGMQIYGIAKDQNGTKYYMVKNSWGETGKYKGLWYASESFVRYKTISAVVNKASLPKDTAKKLGIR